jgi:hypothetical protein
LIGDLPGACDTGDEESRAGSDGETNGEHPAQARSEAPDSRAFRLSCTVLPRPYADRR